MGRDDGSPNETVGRPARLGILVLAGLALLPAPAFGHDGESGLKPVATGIEPAAAGVSVDVKVIVAPAVFVRNTGRRPLEILGADGRPFVRIGPRGVEGNLASPDLYRSNAPAPGSPVPERARSGAVPVWARLSRERAWSWFEHRLGGFGTRAGDGWTIPARLGGKDARLRGTWVSVRRRGAFRTVVEAIQPATPGVKVEPLGNGPALLAQNTTRRVLEVPDRTGKPFLRIGPAGVETRRPGGSWTKLGSTPAWAWLEHRAGSETEEPPANLVEATKVTPVRRWSIRLRLGGRPLAVSGRVEWVPVAAHHAGASSGGISRRELVLLFAAAPLGLGLLMLLGRFRARFRMKP